MHFSHAPGWYSSSTTPTLPYTVLTNAGRLARDQFGYSVSVSGTTAIIGANSTDTGAGNAGSAYIFDLVTNQLIHTLDNPNPIIYDEFGNSVAISGNNAVVGAAGKDIGATTDVGQAYVYNVTTGALVSTLVNPNPSATDLFGYSVAIDGNYAIVGAILEDTGVTNSGRAYVFNATTGALVSTLVNPRPTAYDYFGSSVAISGNYAVVGAYGDDVVYANASDGAGYVFNILTGALVSTLVNPTPYASDQFGECIAMNGNTIVVGVQYADSGVVTTDNVGKIYVFDALTGALRYTLNNPTPALYGGFGAAVAVSSKYIAVGAPMITIGGINRVGEAYVFDVVTGELVKTLFAPAPYVINDWFGFSVAVDQQRVVVGAYGKDIVGVDSGEAYVFVID